MLSDTEKEKEDEYRRQHGPLSQDEFENLPEYKKPNYRVESVNNGYPAYTGMNKDILTYYLRTEAEQQAKNAELENTRHRLENGPMNQREFDEMVPFKKRSDYEYTTERRGLQNYMYGVKTFYKIGTVKRLPQEQFLNASTLPLSETHYRSLAAEQQKLYWPKYTHKGRQDDMVIETHYILKTPDELLRETEKEKEDQYRRQHGPLTQDEFENLPEFEKPKYRVESVNNGYPAYTGMNKDILTYYIKTEAEEQAEKAELENTRLMLENGPMNQREFDETVPFERRGAYEYTTEWRGPQNDMYEEKTFYKIGTVRR